MKKALVLIFFIAAASVSAEELKVLLVGDILTGVVEPEDHWFNKKLKEHGHGYPFEKLSDFIKAHDVAVGNLEGVLSERGVQREKEFVFRGSPAFAEALKDAGFTIMALANNHSFDFSEEGLFDTIDALEKNGIETIGAGRHFKQAYGPVIIGSSSTLKAGFLAFSDVGYPVQPLVACSKEEVSWRIINDAKKECDFLFVSFHWGKEKAQKPNERQKTLARKAIEAGADVVWGHHPHYTQAFGTYIGKPIFYSLGEFVFYRTERNQEIAQVTLTKNGKSKKIEHKIIPIVIIDGQPQFAAPEDKDILPEQSAN
ncbi:MAG: CapA family protein [Endomicrobiales bacterium]|nr:CapA family protein [Endomicrobiales bacterium]